MATGGIERPWGTDQDAPKSTIVSDDATRLRVAQFLQGVFIPNHEESLSDRALWLRFANLPGFLDVRLEEAALSVKPLLKRTGILGGSEDYRLNTSSVIGSSNPMNPAVIFDADKLGVTGHSSFNTIKANTCVYKGKWVYEVLLGSKGLMQIGWCMVNCVFTSTEGVGDTPNSYSYDGYRVRKWNYQTEIYGKTWQTGDVIGCAIDCDEGFVEFFRNGKSMGVAYDDIALGPGCAYFPALSLAQGETVRVNFGAIPLLYPIDGYEPFKIPDSISSAVAGCLLTYLGRLLHVCRQCGAATHASNGNKLLKEQQQAVTSSRLCSCEPLSEPLAMTAAFDQLIVLAGAHIFANLGVLLKSVYVVNASFIPFLCELVDEQHGPVILDRLIRLMWALMEDHEIKICLEHVAVGLLTYYRFSTTSNDFALQSVNLRVLLSFLRHEASGDYLLQYVLFDKVTFPLFFYIKQPDEDVLRSGVPTVWWQSERRKAMDAVADIKLRHRYDEACASLRSQAAELEHLQVLILRSLLAASSGETSGTNRKRLNRSTITTAPSPAARSTMFLSKLRELVCSPQPTLQQHAPLLLSLFHCLARVVQELLAEGKRSSRRPVTAAAIVNTATDFYVPVSKFVDLSIDYMELQRLGGLNSHLRRSVGAEPLEEELRRLSLCDRSTLVLDSGASVMSEDCLLELLDDCVLLYSSAAHAQLQKVATLVSESVDGYIAALEDTEEKLAKCPPELADVKIELIRAKCVLEDKVTDQARHLSWHAAVTCSHQKMLDIVWLMRATLFTVERASQHHRLFAFTPDVYVNVCLDSFVALKSYFTLSTVSFSELPEYSELLQKYGIFLVKHFLDARIVDVDTKDALIQALASFVCYEDTLRILEELPSDLKSHMVRSLLAPYESRPWTETNRILARLWKGDGYAFRYIHLPHVAPTRHQMQEINRAGLQKPCPSKIFQKLVSAELLADTPLATQFVNSVLNQLNWAFSEFVGMVRELQQLSISMDRSYVDMRQLRICATCFEISVGLLRVLEMVSRVAPFIFMDTANSSSAVLLARLFQSLCLILNRVAKKSDIFQTVLSLNLPGMESVDHFPIAAAVIGIIVSLIPLAASTEEKEHCATALIKEAGFDLSVLKQLLGDGDGGGSHLSASAACLAMSVSVQANRTNFTLKNNKEVSPEEICLLEDLIAFICKKRDDIDGSCQINTKDEDNSCPICCAEVLSAVFLPCKHQSCRTCIIHHILQSKRCFFCMGIITRIEDLNGKEIKI